MFKRSVLQSALAGAAVSIALLLGPAQPHALAQGASQIITRTGNAPPEGNGTFSTFSIPILNNAGQIAFRSTLTGTAGGTNDGRGIYRADGTTLTVIQREFSFFGSLSNLTSPAGLNDAGQVLYTTTITPFLSTPINQVRLGSGGGTDTVIAAQGNDAPDDMGVTNGSFLTLGSPTLNASGQATFLASLTGTTGGTSDDLGIFLNSGGTDTQVARKGQPAPDNNGTGSTNGSFLDLNNNLALNASGQAAFFADLTGTAGGTSDDEGIFLGSGGAITQIARKGQPAPDDMGNTNGSFLDINNNPALNASGQVAFFASLTGTAGETSHNSGIFIGSGGAITQVARAGQTAPDGNGLFSSLGTPALNDSGQAAFVASLTSGSSDNEGIFLGSGGAVTQVVRKGQTTPDGNGSFSTFSTPALNASGQTAFNASLTGTAGGATDNRGIFIADGFDTVQIAREGQTFAGSTISFLSLGDSRGADGDARSGINDAGQVTYLVNLTSGGEAIALWTPPDAHWTAGSGSWNTTANWAQGITPKSLFDVFLDPASGATIEDDIANEYVKSLTVGSTTGAQVTLNQDSSDLTAVQGPITINPTGKINLGNNRILNAPALTNAGVISGNGQVNATLTNTTSGEVRIGAGENLRFTGANNTNAGNIEIGGGQIEFTQDLRSFGSIDVIGGTLRVNGTMTNSSTGQMSVRNATLRFNGGLENQGLIAMSFGTTDVFGFVRTLPSVIIGTTTIAGPGRIIVAGNSNATFFDDVDNDGIIQVTTGSTAVYFGTVTGTGIFTGGGINFFESIFSPGSSPGEITIDGDAVLGSGATLVMELAGTQLGTQYDHLNIAGDLAANGTLDIQLLNNFAPSLGDTFDLLDFGSITGAFGSINLPSLASGLSFDTSSLLTTGSIAVVPEPTTAMLVTFLSLIAMHRRPSKQI